MERDDPCDENDGEELEAEIMRADRPFAADRRATTAEEELTDLSIDDALARERPDVPPTDVVVGIEDEGEPDVVGELSGGRFRRGGRVRLTRRGCARDPPRRPGSDGP